MPLDPGSRIGVYEVGAPIGAGGMGDVYRARDTALGREVAIKILSAASVSNPESQSRFEREARALAALNHPHIATLYGVERDGDTRALVMELVEGETLADRLSRGRLQASEALSIARQIADAIEAAHAKGIVHRDLKPANIKVTASGVVKVLDFGLAKAAGGTSFDAQLPTMADATLEGAIVGTAAYMSPQQARGQAVERDADIWAFGCVLFEMLAGRRAFPGETVSDTIANVLQREPDWTMLAPATPGEAVRLVRRCLTKDAARRLRDMADARLEIDDLLANPAASSPTTILTPPPATPLHRMRRLAVGVTIALAIGVALGALVQRWIGGQAPATHPPEATVFGMLEPSGESLYLFVTPIALSPDGRQIALVTNGPEGQPRLWLRSMNDLEPKLVEDAAGARFPFWSPDGRSLGFVAQGALRVLDLASNSVRTVAPMSGPGGAGTWNREGTILYMASLTSLAQVSAAGGQPVPVPSPGPSGESTMVGYPEFLPDGRHFLYYAAGNQAGQGALMVGDLASTSRAQVLAVDSIVRYAPPGYLLYVRNGELVAHRFDSTRRQVVGDPSVVGRGLWVWRFMSAFSASETGVLAFATQRAPVTQLTWVDRDGKALGSLGEPGLWMHAAVSPDEKAVAAEQLDPRTGTGGIWTIDVARGVASRVSIGSNSGMAPVWSPGSDRLAYASYDSLGQMTIAVATADGSGRVESLFASSSVANASDWRPDGRGVVFNSTSSTASDVFMVPIDGDRKPTLLVQTPFNEGYGKVSPNSRWLAYASNESGRPEIYVRAFGEGAGRWRVSKTGGSQPRWRRDGRELYFVSEARRIMAAAIGAGPVFEAGAPTELPIETERDFMGARYMYDVADLGRRFLVIRREARESAPPMTVIVNWPALVR